MRRRIAAWLACSPPERRLLWEAWLLLLGVGAGLRCLSLPRVQSLLRRLEGSPRSRLAAGAIDADRLACLVAVTARHHVWAVSCLEKSLALQTLLGRRGLLPELRIGVRREDGGALQAHAWVEINGRPLGEAPDVVRHFPPLAENLQR